MFGSLFERSSGRVSPQPLGVGAPAPEFAFTDISGVRGDVADYRDWVVVYTAADRDSYQGLMDWQRGVGLEAARRWPHLKVAYVNIADVTIVPSMMRGLVEPVIKHVAEGAFEELAVSYQKQGIELDPEYFRIHLIADWSGEYLRTLGLSRAQSYTVWVAQDRRIEGQFAGSNGAAMNRDFMSLFARLAEERLPH